MNQEIIEPILCETVKHLPLEVPFSYFTAGFGEWWPRDYTFSKQLLSGIYFGKAVGDWGRILEWNPPHLVACTEVLVHFSESSSTKSCVKLAQKYFEHHGADAADYRADMASDYGWPLLFKGSAHRHRAYND